VVTPRKPSAAFRTAASTAANAAARSARPPCSSRGEDHAATGSWGPDNEATVAGFAARFQPLDAAAGKLLEIPVKPQIEAGFSTSVGVCDFLDPAFALDGNDATFFKSAAGPNKGDHFTVTFKEPKLVHAIEVLTGVNGGEVQVSTDATNFTTVGKLDQGAAKVVLKDNRVRAVRLLAESEQSEPLVVRSINLRMMVEVSGAVHNPNAAVGAGNVAVTTGDTAIQSSPTRSAPARSPSSTATSPSGSTTAESHAAPAGPSRAPARWRFTRGARMRR
jgi:hypothetical protein